MRYLLTLLIVFLISYTSTVIAEDDPYLIGLEKKYDTTQNLILEDCAYDADWVERVARQRDGGVSMRVMHDLLIDDAAEQNETKEDKFTTREVLYRITLIIWIYSNHEMSAKEIYTASNTYCIVQAQGYLDVLYNRTKVYYKLQNIKTVPIE